MTQRHDTLALQCKVELADWNETIGTGCTLPARVPDTESVGILRGVLARRLHDVGPRRCCIYETRMDALDI